MAPVTRSRRTETESSRLSQPTNVYLPAGTSDNSVSSDINPSAIQNPPLRRKSPGLLKFLFSGGQDAKSSPSTAKKLKPKRQPKGKLKRQKVSEVN